MPRALSICSSPAALTPVPMATNQTMKASAAGEKADRPRHRHQQAGQDDAGEGAAEHGDDRVAVAQAVNGLRTMLANACPDRPAGRPDG